MARCFMLASIIAGYILPLASSVDQNLFLTVIGGGGPVGATNTIYDLSIGANYAGSISKVKHLYGYGSTLINNTIYVAGSYTIASARNIFAAYNILLDSWEYFPPVPVSEEWGFNSMVAYGNTVFTLGGGTGDGYKNSNRVFKFDDVKSVNGTWKEMASLPHSANQASANILITGSIPYLYVIGGSALSDQIVRTALDGSTLSWTRVAMLKGRRHGHKSVVVNGIIYIIGGTTDNTVEAYETATASASTISKQSMSFNRRNFGAVVVPNSGQILACGGGWDGGCELYDIVRDQWTELAFRLVTPDTFGFDMYLTSAVPWVVSNNLNTNQSLCAFPDVQYRSTRTNVTKCYRAFTSSKLDWPHAKVACKLWGGHLVTINSADENIWVAATLLPTAGENDRAWIGMHSHESFGWNGASVNMVIESAQNSQLLGQTSSFPLHCGYISVTGNWYSRECWSNYSFVCEKPFKGVPESATITTTASSPYSTTCSPFGTVANCNITLLGQYGTVQQDRGTCLILGGIDLNVAPLSWSAASDKCRSIYNGDLVEIEDAIKWQAVTNLASIAQARTQASGAWTGLQNFYRWTDAHTVRNFGRFHQLPTVLRGKCLRS